MGHDCSQRTCPKGTAWTTEKVDGENLAHPRLSAPTRELAIVQVESVGASRTTMARLVSVRSVLMIARDVEFACHRRPSPPWLVRRTPSPGMPISTWDASVMKDTVVRTALRRSAHREKISLVVMVPRKDASALDVATVTLEWVFAPALMDTTGTGASTKPF